MEAFLSIIKRAIQSRHPPKEEPYIFLCDKNCMDLRIREDDAFTALHPPHPGTSTNLTAQPCPYKHGRGIDALRHAKRLSYIHKSMNATFTLRHTRLLRLWPTLIAIQDFSSSALILAGRGMARI